MKNTVSVPDRSTPAAMDRVIAAVRAARRVVVTAHVRPDGDALGSALGLRDFLRSASIPVLLTGIEPLPESIVYLKGSGDVLPASKFQPERGDLLFLLDCNDEMRISAALRAWTDTLPVACVDHHQADLYLSDAVYAVPDASSTSELVWNLGKRAGWTLTRAGAEALWAGIITDTNRFSYSCTTPATLRCAAELLEGYGIDADRAANEAYNLVSEKRFALQRRLMDSVERLRDGTVSVATLCPSDYEELGATTADSANMVDIPRFLRGTEIALFLYPAAEGRTTAVSMRAAPPYDAAAFCSRYKNGGGHTRAAGAVVNIPLPASREKILTDLLDWKDGQDAAAAKGAKR